MVTFSTEFTYAFLIMKRMKIPFWLHTLLYSRVFVLPRMEALDGKGVGGGMNWTPGAPSHAYILTGRDVLSPCSAKLSTAGIYQAVRASLYIYEYSNPLMKVFVECWSPSPKNLLLPYSELSISLWDLYKLGGLPIAGHLMDEVVPSTECISSSLDKKGRIPEPCRSLLHAYHHLATSSSYLSISPAE
ncbi:hypothetical protein LIER_15864 [Lithospermum erythrorhizon]|uniref:Uncharacterized protein n=1 Tax=Lithospermum erythrorhizon TaxID=34254 RepID=A0AAV3Q6X3_LITER